MSIKPPPGLTEDDFEAIEDAVMETARGRWFLREFARRARSAETAHLLEAITRIERIVSGQSALPGGFDIETHALALGERQKRFAEIAWTLRERGYDGSICSMIENEARALGRVSDSVRGAGPMVEAEAGPRKAPDRMISPPQLPKPVVAPPLPESSAQPRATLPLRPEPASAPPFQPAPVQPRLDAPRDRRLERLADIDRLAPREKSALFG
jgi:hypothetical protein